MRSKDEVFEAIRTELLRLLEPKGIRLIDIQLEASIVTDLGMDSLLFVDLIIALEGALGIAQFPMQEWVDEQALSVPPDRPRYTVDSLTCCACKMLGIEA